MTPLRIQIGFKKKSLWGKAQLNKYVYMQKNLKQFIHFNLYFNLYLEVQKGVWESKEGEGVGRVWIL